MKTVPFNRDFEQMLISAERYALGRATYIVSSTVNYIAGFRKELSDWCIGIIIQDINSELEMCERMNRMIGMQCDHNNWLWLKNVLEDEQEKRKVAQND